ncbi:MAG TPA: M3 family metallopeptidase [Gemmatimonadales bacterium]|nr:M3 family metallopeptidase [Gemmatimonadales bacterium]
MSVVPVSKRVRQAGLLAVALIASLDAAEAQQTMTADDSLESWRLPAPAIAGRCRQGVANAHQALEAVLTASSSPSGSAFAALQRIEQANAALQSVTALPRALQVLSPDAATRDSAVACDQLVANFQAATAADARLYALAQRARQELRSTDDSITAADRQLAELYVEAGRLAGAGLDSAGRARTVRLLQRHADLERDFSIALAGDSSRVRIPLRDTLDLDPQFRSQLTREGDSASVKVDESTFGPFMQSVSDRAARRRFYIAYNRRAGEANAARLDSALAVRDTLARLLGFPNWGAYQVSTRMAKTPDRVFALLSSLKTPLRRKALTEVAALRPLARKDGLTGQLEMWDYYYYQERLRKSRYALSEDEVKQYFPVDFVLPAVMSLYGDLLGLRFMPVTPANGWAPDMSRYTVVDSATDAPLGRLYFDLYPRPYKYGHFADFTVVPTFQRPDGSRQLAWTAIVGNWSLPVPGRPSLLTHDEVVTLFHEFGHAMAAVLDRSPYPTTSNDRLDFVEAPSQMLENWMWQPAILRRISHHAATGQPLPDSLIQRIVDLKHLNDGVYWGRQVFFAAYDMTLHTSPRRVNPTTTYLQMLPQFVPFRIPTGTVPESGFSHIMGGYEAGVYSYLWAKVYAQDMFSRFQREGILNPQTGRAYRDVILAPSGTEEPDSLVQRFLGRPVNNAAFYRELGVSAGTGATR